MTRSMTNKMLLAMAMSALIIAGCADDESAAENDEDLPTNADVEAPLEDLDTLTDGAPDNDDLPAEAKADETFPVQFDLVDSQSPVSDQGSRGICSAFSTVGLVEHLYLLVDDKPNPEFSEQYLQWSVKQQVGAFTETSGSNARFNLEAVSNYGIVEEQLWPYESSPWGTADDEECSGDDRPTRCYTNGSPPDEAVDGPKYSLPDGRWISTRPRDLKAHMYNQGTGVVVGGDFFYQSWNHGASELPTNQDYWREGYVPYPNEADQESSGENPVGHSILLVGWDDDLEVERIDGDAQVITNEDGEAETEQGFFIFKNSWGTGSFGVNNPYGDGYGFISYDYVREYKSGRVAGLPQPEHLPEQQVGPDCGADELECGGECVAVDEDNCGECGNQCAGAESCLDNQCIVPDCDTDDPDCSNPDCFQESVCQGQEETFSSDEEMTIPDNDPAGVTSEIEVESPGLIQSMEVDVYVEHSYNGDIRIDLVHPDGQEIMLREADGTPGSDIVDFYEVDEFDGMESQGSWALRLTDTAEYDEGSLLGWDLRITR